MLGSTIIDFDWQSSFHAGETDRSGNRLGGTEARNFEVFDGKIFAGNGYWMDPQARDIPGAQVLVLENPDGKWQQDLCLDETGPEGYKVYGVISTMKAVSFANNYGGHLLYPVPMLLVSTWDLTDRVSVFARKTGDSDWFKSDVLPKDIIDPVIHIRSFGFHRDTESGIDMVFGGLSRGLGIISGTYSPESPGYIRWESQPEAFREGDEPGDYDRVMSFVEINNKLYATICGKIYQRQDGESPVWEKLYTHEYERCTAARGEHAFRGATYVEHENSLLLGFEGNRSGIERISSDGNGFTFVRELDVIEYLQSRANTTVKYAIVAYNRLVPFELPTTGERVMLAGFECTMPDIRWTWNWHNPGGWFFVRREDRKYEIHQIIDKDVFPRDLMVATRDLVVSPFEDDVIYACGFDANANACHDTGWIYKGRFTGE
jgi:hypothetical protein